MVELDRGARSGALGSKWISLPIAVGKGFEERCVAASSKQREGAQVCWWPAKRARAEKHFFLSSISRAFVR